MVLLVWEWNDHLACLVHFCLLPLHGYWVLDGTSQKLVPSLSTGLRYYCRQLADFLCKIFGKSHFVWFMLVYTILGSTFSMETYTKQKKKLAVLSVLSETKLYKEDPHWFKWIADARMRKAKLGQAKTVLGPQCNGAYVGNREFGWNQLLVTRN